MPFAVVCPECRSKFNVPDQVDGQRGKCPKCSAVFQARRPKASDSVPVFATVESEEPPPVEETQAASAKGKTVSIPKPRLLESLRKPAPAPAVESPEPDAPPPTPVPPPPQPASRGAGAKPSVAENGAAPVAAPPAPKQKSPSAPPAKSPVKPPAMPPVKPPPANEPAVPPLDVDSEPPEPMPAALSLGDLQIDTGDARLPPLGSSSVAGKVSSAKGKPAPGAATSVAVKESAPRSQRRTRQMLAAVAICLAITLVAGGLVWLLGDSLLTAARDGAAEPAASTDDAGTNPFDFDGAATSAAGTTAANPDDGAPPLTSDAVRRARSAMVEVNVTGPAGSRTGCGFLVDRRGSIVTSFALLRDARRAEVTLADGRKFAVAGRLNGAPDRGYVLLKLAAAPDDLPVLVVRQGPPPVGRTAYLVDRATPLAAQVERQMATADLPPHAREHLPPRLRENSDLRLIVHSGSVGQGSDGAPLVDDDGRLVGMHLFLGEGLERGYASPGGGVMGLIAQAQPDHVLPLSGDDLASTNPLPIPPVPVDPADGPGDPPAVPTPLPADVFAAPMESLGKLAELLADLNWQAVDGEKYAGLQEFATALTAIADQVSAAGLEPADKERLEGRLDEIIGGLVNAAWPSEDEMKATNTLSTSDEANRSEGVFAFGRCIARPENFVGGGLMGQPCCGFEVIGTERVLVVPVSQQADRIKIGSVWLVVGRKIGTTMLSHPDMPEKPPVTADIVRSKHLLGQPN